MRLSLRKVVKYSTFLFTFFTMNIWVSYNVNLWSFSDTHGHEKVRKSLGPLQNFDDNGNGGVGEVFVEQNIVNRNDPFETLSDLRKQRSAKSLSSYDAPSLGSVKQNALSHNSHEPVQQVALNSKSTSASAVHDKPFKRDSRHLTELEDVYISVKTTFKYHVSRVKLLLKTWYQLAAKQTYFFTDGNDRMLSPLLGEHLVNTNCSTDHSRRALSCKMAVEIDSYMASRKRWFCHVDDDVYVNVPQLVELLRKYNHKEDWYLGKPSLKHPLEVADRENPGVATPSCSVTEE